MECSNEYCENNNTDDINIEFGYICDFCENEFCEQCVKITTFALLICEVCKEENLV